LKGPSGLIIFGVINARSANPVLSNPVLSLGCLIPNSDFKTAPSDGVLWNRNRS